MFSRLVNTSHTPSKSPSSSCNEPLFPSQRIRSQSTTRTPPQLPDSLPPQSSQTLTSAPPTGVVERLMHKNDLQCYCQRLHIPLPVYQTAFGNIGHTLTYRATVSVGKNDFTSQNTFSNRKSAEQDAAKLALEYLLKEDDVSATDSPVDLRKLVCQDKAPCKMIIHEFLAKRRMEYSYETIQVEIMPPMFASSLALNGKCYKGKGKSKKDAEQVAALEAILSLLDDTRYGALISTVIKSKFSGILVNKKKQVNSQNTFSNQESEEQDVREIFLESFRISYTDSPEYLGKLVCQDKAPCKMIIHEFLAKRRMEYSYETIQVEIMPPMFASSLALNGKCYKGNGKSKKDAEQVAALEAILSLLDDTRYGALISIVIKSKFNGTILVNSLPWTKKHGGQAVLFDEQCGAGRPTEGSCSYAHLPRTSQLSSGPQHGIKLREVAQISTSTFSANKCLAYDSIFSEGKQKNNKKKRKKGTVS